MTKPKGIAAAKCALNMYRQSARLRNLGWKISFADFLVLTKEDCYYCGSPPSNIKMAPGYNGSYIYNGLDRIDNEKGYTADNVVPCCKRCNFAKGTSSLEDFMNWIDKLVIFRIEKEIDD